MPDFFFIRALITILGYLFIPIPLFTDPYSTLLYTEENQLLGARIAADEQWRFPPSDTLPEKFSTCLIQFEDKHFYIHPGIDPIAIMRASIQNIRNKRIVSGGSTISMQLARIVCRNEERTLKAKSMEIALALALETRFSKKELLQLYATHAPFGGNVVGAETAAWRYFGRSLNSLSWAESATLAILPNAPALIHPGRNREQLQTKRNRLLMRLQQQGLIDKTTFELACMEPLPDAPVPLPNQAPHLLDRLARDNKAQRLVCTLNNDLQQQVQQFVNRYAREYTSNYICNVAALITETETGKVIAYAGNATFDAAPDKGNQVDIIMAPRSTGSVLKPFLYAAMLHEGDLLPDMLISDTPLNINGFTPQNYNKTYQGVVAARRAIEQSLNVPLVRMLSAYQTGRFMHLLKQYGMTTLRFPESHYGASLILGGAEGTLWDMTGMYASMARVLGHFRPYNGRYNPADIHSLLVVPTEEEKPIRNITDPRLTDKPVLSASALWFTFEAMSALNRPEEESEWQQFSSMKRIAWKTGTSYGGRDAWAIGTTPLYTIGVWVGNSSGEGRAGLTGVGNAAPVLFDLFSLVPGSDWFDEPLDEMTEMPVCRKSGHKASPLCEVTDTLYVPKAGEKTVVCPYHKQVHLSADMRYRVNSSCEPVSRIKTCSWFVLSPAQAYYYKNHDIDYKPLPPLRGDCGQAQDRPIELIYPEHNAVVYQPKGFGSEREKVVFKAAHARPDAIIYWHLDNRFLGETTGNHQLACTLPPGKHQLTLVDEQGFQRKILFDVK